MASVLGRPLGERTHVCAASASNVDDITHIFEGFASKQDSGIIVPPNPVTTDNRGLIIALMARYRLPAAYGFACRRELPAAGMPDGELADLDRSEALVKGFSQAV
jgi:hypothetical protein